jgi:hypothetical protein
MTLVVAGQGIIQFKGKEICGQQHYQKVMSQESAGIELILFAGEKDSI